MFREQEYSATSADRANRNVERRILAKADPQQLASGALSRALSDPAPRVLLGTKAKPGIFDSQTAKVAAQLCIDQGWLKATGQFEGKGKSRKELYAITPAGIQSVLENSEPAK